MARSSTPVLLFRVIVFALAAYYTAWQLGTSNWASPGGPLRYLTNWALVLSCVSAAMMLALSLGRVRHAPWLEVLASITAVMNAVVVIQYWRLYLDDPGNVNNGDPIAAWLEYYLHLAGPVLQWIDALFLLGAFRRHLRSLIALIGFVVLYAAWAELFVGPMNSKPVGSVTSGLPYPFLNNMELSARMVFYAVNAAVVLVLYAAFVGLARLVGRRGGA